MGAQTVTGRGVGSAESSAKGTRERNFVGVERLIGPRVVAAGKATVAQAATTFTVNFRVPLPCVTPLSAQAITPTPENDYVILLANQTLASRAMTVALTNSDALGVTHSSALDTCLKGFTVSVCTAGDVVGWTVVKVGD